MSHKQYSQVGDDLTIPVASVATEQGQRYLTDAFIGHMLGVDWFETDNVLTSTWNTSANHDFGLLFAKPAMLYVIKNVARPIRTDDDPKSASTLIVKNWWDSAGIQTAANRSKAVVVMYSAS